MSVFVNPHGILFRTLTTREVTPNSVTLEGSASLDSTWFNNYAWTMACCSRCGMHLGWRYDYAPPEHIDLEANRVRWDASVRDMVVIPVRTGLSAGSAELSLFEQMVGLNAGGIDDEDDDEQDNDDMGDDDGNDDISGAEDDESHAEDASDGSDGDDAAAVHVNSTGSDESHFWSATGSDAEAEADEAAIDNDGLNDIDDDDVDVTIPPDSGRISPPRQLAGQGAARGAAAAAGPGPPPAQQDNQAPSDGGAADIEEAEEEDLEGIMDGYVPGEDYVETIAESTSPRRRLSPIAPSRGTDVTGGDGDGDVGLQRVAAEPPLPPGRTAPDRASDVASASRSRAGADASTSSAASTAPQLAGIIVEEPGATGAGASTIPPAVQDRGAMATLAARLLGSAEGAGVHGSWLWNLLHTAAAGAAASAGASVGRTARLQRPPRRLLSEVVPAPAGGLPRHFYGLRQECVRCRARSSTDGIPPHNNHETLG